MSELGDFQDLVNEITDTELLEVAEDLLKDMTSIENMKEKIEMLEGGLSKGDRAAFWFFAIGLDKDQVDLATNTIIGRRRFLTDKSDREKVNKEIDAADSEQISAEPSE